MNEMKNTERIYWGTHNSVYSLRGRVAVCLASDVSERPAACIFTMKEEGTFALCLVSCASAQFLSGRRVALSGREIVALYICPAFVGDPSYQI